MKSIFIVCILCFVFGCKKAENRSCWKLTGKEIEIKKSLNSFNQLALYEHIDYVLVQDSTNHLVIRGGENVVQLVESKIENGKLIVSNKNRCSFLRKQKKIIQVEIHFTSLDFIYYQGTEFLKNKDTLTFNIISISHRDGAGSIDLAINANSLSCSGEQGWGDFKLKGTVQNAYIALKANMYCDVSNLNVTSYLYAANESVGLMKLNAENCLLKGHIKSNGNIEYSGNPIETSIFITGKGKLIKV